MLPQRRQRHARFGLHLLESPRQRHALPDGEVLHFGLENAQQLGMTLVPTAPAAQAA